MEESKVKKDYTKDVEYLNNYLAEKAIILEQSCKHITDRWKEHNIDNVFYLHTRVICFNGSFRLKVIVESEIGTHNVIFYSRQEAVSTEMINHKDELKMAVQDFILSVMGDFIEKGMESMRVGVIEDNRARAFEHSDDVPNDKSYEDFLLCYPLKSDDVFPKTK